MATSGTFGFNLDISDIFEEAYEQIGKELRTGYDYRTARRSLNLLLLEWQNKGLNLWTVKNISQALTAGTKSYELSSEKVDVIECQLRTDAGDTSKQTDINLRRVSVSTYARQTNKLTTGRPTQYWVERAPTAVTLHLWPVPDSSNYALNYYYMEQIEDVGGSAANNVDIPVRHLPALTAGLAYYLGKKARLPASEMTILKAIYDEQWQLAADSVREKASLFLVPGGY